MNTKISFFRRLFLIVGLALLLITVVPASASNLAAPSEWLAIRPPHHMMLAIIPTPSGSTTTESGVTATISVVLDADPGSAVTVPVSSSDITEGTVSPDQLVFNSSNYYEPHLITVYGQDDYVVDGDVPYNIQIGPGSAGENPAVNVPLTNIDNDVAGITVSAISGPTSEDLTTATFTVVLTSEPIGEVTIGVTSSDLTEGIVNKASLTFTAGNWQDSQIVTVTGQNDDIADGNVPYTIVLANPTGGDPAYNAIDPVDVSVTNNDNDTAGINVSAISGPTSEALATATFTVVLTSEPIGEVTIGVTSGDLTEGIVDKPSLTFTSTDWFTSQIVTVTGQNDDIADGNVPYTIVLANPTGGDPAYNAIDPADVSVTNNDNDTAGIIVDPTEGLITTESSGSATFEVSLMSQPTYDVILNLGSDDVTEGQASPMSLTFTAADWDEPHVVNVVGADDDQIDGDVDYEIITDPAISDDPNYDELNPDDVSVTNQDNDVAAFIIDHTSGLITSENGLKAYFTVALDSQPTQNVSFTLQSSDTTEGIVFPGSLTFTPVNWMTPQSVAITGINDYIHDGNVPYMIITHPATSDDPHYLGVNAEDVSVTNSDDDTPGFVISPGAPDFPLYTSEGEASAAINILLSTEPTADVFFTFTSADITEGVFSLTKPAQPITISFTPTNWNTVQTIQLIGVDDLEDDGNVHYTVDVQSSSADGDYNVKLRKLSAINMDAPTIEWVLPVDHDPYYVTPNLGPILLGVEPAGEEADAIDAIQFKRWNPDLDTYESLIRDPDPPYQFYLYPQELDFGFNQIYAYANPDGTWSKWELLLIYRMMFLFLPAIRK